MLVLASGAVVQRTTIVVVGVLIAWRGLRLFWLMKHRDDDNALAPLVTYGWAIAAMQVTCGVLAITAALLRNYVLGVTAAVLLLAVPLTREAAARKLGRQQNG